MDNCEDCCHSKETYISLIREGCYILHCYIYDDLVFAWSQCPLFKGCANEP